MFLASVEKNRLTVTNKELLTSGSVNVYQVAFQFSADWDGLDRTAVFRSGNEKISMLLDGENQCQIPWEVLRTPNQKLYVGVYGTRRGEIVLPTIWEYLGEIRPGATAGEDPQDPTPGAYDQILNAAKDAKAIAQSVRDDADAGKFDGKPGPQGPKGQAGDGVPEITDGDEDKVMMVKGGAAVWAAIGEGNLVSQDVKTIRVLDWEEYEQSEKSPDTLYFIKG